MTQLEIFISECQTKASQGISRLEGEILSSFSTTYDGPSAETISTIMAGISFDLPAGISELGAYTETNAARVTYSPHLTKMWQGEMTTLQTAISAALTNGGIGISQALQDALFNEDRGRKSQILEDALRKVDAGVGGKGFRMRNDYLAGQRQELILRYRDDLEELNRKITAMMEQHARENWQFCIQNGISAEKFQADFTGAYDKLVVDMAHATVEIYRAEVELTIAKFKAKAEAIMAQWSAAKLKLEAGATAVAAKATEMELRIKSAAADANTAVASHSAEAQRLVGAYKSYGELVQSFAVTASGVQIGRA